MEGISTRSFLAHLGTFIAVFIVAPALAVAALHALPVEHPERYRSAVAFFTAIAVYSILRRRFGDRLPQV
ncbi:hypothetical protein [Symbiobacterium terraclitae]|uniref:hypothetical protein n=1 Tax=Symbiobacterium terraclitae TaxID=557451 RepID=UPI0035B509BD